MTNDRPIHKLNHQWQASIHFNCSMVGHYDVIFIGTMKSFDVILMGGNYNEFPINIFYLEIFYIPTLNWS